MRFEGNGQMFCQRCSMWGRGRMVQGGVSKDWGCVDGAGEMNRHKKILRAVGHT